MTQNHTKDIDFSSAVLEKRITNSAQSILNTNNTEVYLNNLTEYTARLSVKNSNSNVLDEIIVTLNSLRKIYIKSDAFIVIELIETLLQMLVKINSLNLKLNTNNIKIIAKSIEMLPQLITQYFDNNIMLTDEVLWCLDAADAVRENDNFFLIDDFNNDNSDKAILFGKEVTDDISIPNNNLKHDFINFDSTNHNESNNTEHTEKTDILCSITCKKTEIDFLQEACYLTKKINDGFNTSIRENKLYNFIFSIINSLNLIKTSAISFNYRDIANICYFISKVYNSIIVHSIEVSNAIISILSRLHTYLIKYIEIYLNRESIDKKENIEQQIKNLYFEFLNYTNLINNKELISNNDYHNIINSSNFAIFFKKNHYETKQKNTTTQHKAPENYIPGYISAVGLRYNLTSLINNQINITINENILYIKYDLYTNIVSFVTNILSCSSLAQIIESKKTSNESNLAINIYQEGINLILDVIDSSYTVNDDNILKKIIAHKITPFNNAINLYNRFNLLYKIENKLSLTQNNNSLYNLNTKVRKSGGHLLLDKDIYSAIKFSIRMPITKNIDMLVVKSANTMYAIPSEFILDTTKNLEKQQYKDVVLLDNILNKKNKQNLVYNYNELVIIEFNKKIIPIAVDKITGFHSLSLNTLPFPITHVKSIDAVGLMENNNIVFIVNVFYLFNIYTSSM